jgi:Protein of unknown function (DUF3187)
MITTGMRTMRRARWRRAGVVALVSLAPLGPGAAQAEPFLSRNQNPLLALYGLPSPLPARLPAPAEWRVASVVHWANSASIETSGESAFTLDAETLELRVHLERALGPRLSVRAELPWRRVSAGSLDGFIEDWHDWFGLPNGSRDRLPRNELLIEYLVAGATLLRVDESTSGIGDIPLSVGYQLQASESRALAAWLTVKAPTGDAGELTGSGAVDVALSLAWQAAVHADWDLFAQANAVWLGEGDLLPGLQEDAAWSALAGATWNPWRALDLTAQLEANSRVFDAGTNLAGDAVVLTFGAGYRTSGGWRFDFGISEDIEVSASPDVAFSLAVRRGF